MLKGQLDQDKEPTFATRPRASNLTLAESTKVSNSHPENRFVDFVTLRVVLVAAFGTLHPRSTIALFLRQENELDI